MANRSLTRTDLVDALKREVGLSRADSILILKEVLDEITACLARGVPFKITSFASFSVRHKKGRMGRNPMTGEEAPILPRRVVKFAPSEKLKFKVNASSKTTMAALDD